MKTKIKKKENALDHDDYMDHEYGKIGTKKREEANKRLDKISKEQLLKGNKPTSKTSRKISNKAIAAISLEELFTINFGEKGTKKRTEADEKIQKLIKGGFIGYVEGVPGINT